MNTAEKLEISLTEQIAAQKKKHQLMRKRQRESTTALNEYQNKIDLARDAEDQAFYEATATPCEAAAEAHRDAKREVQRLVIEYTEAQAAQRRLPDRIQESTRHLHSLQNQKAQAIYNKANSVLGKKKETALKSAKTALVKAVAYTAACSQRNNIEKFLGLGHVNVAELVRLMIADPDFRAETEKAYYALMDSLQADQL